MMNTEISNARQLLRLVSESHIYIYGAGFVAERFFYAIAENGMADRVIAFVTTKKEKDFLLGKQVFTFDEMKGDLKDECLICVAVHEIGYFQIYESLTSSGISNMIWIYPFIHELCLGKVIRNNVAISTSDLLRNYLEDYAIPLRYLAIEQYYKKNGIGYDTYIKGMELHCNLQTAVERLKGFVKLIQNWEENGYDHESKLKVTESGKLIDGAHRLALALYFELDELYCDIYADNHYEAFIKDDVRISSGELVYFSQYEISELDRVKTHMNNVK